MLFPVNLWAQTNQAVIGTVYTDTNSTILVSPKQTTFQIRLKSNPTTGYSWFLRDYNAKLIVLTNHEFERPNNKIMGAPGYEVWTLRVRPTAFDVAQKTMLQFVYVRPWEHKNPVKEISFDVVIRK